jgi:membrane-bound metal-dependent hydrolase YbcI (DUF457 family)
LSKGRKVTLAMALAVFSHFVLDLVMHPADLALWPGVCRPSRFRVVAGRAALMVVRGTRVRDDCVKTIDVYHRAET